jgi:hypothetical protein
MSGVTIFIIWDQEREMAKWPRLLCSDRTVTVETPGK